MRSKRGGRAAAFACGRDRIGKSGDGRNGNQGQKQGTVKSPDRIDLPETVNTPAVSGQDPSGRQHNPLGRQHSLAILLGTCLISHAP